MEEKLFYSRLKDMLERVENRYVLEVSDFLEPRQIVLAQQYLQQQHCKYFFWGGYEEAERKRLVLYPDYEECDMALADVVTLRFTGKFDYVKVDHRDFLGAILGLGLRREKLGDLLIDEKGCFVFTTQEMAQFLLQSEIRIKGVPLKGVILQGEYDLPKPELKAIAVMVASMRLDVILANGFKLSRAGAQEFIASHRVKVNHKEVTENDLLLNEGDVLSVRGKGKLKVGECSGSTKKGKLKVELLKYGS